MYRTMVAVVFALSTPGLALACGGKKSADGEATQHAAAHGDAARHEAAPSSAAIDPTHCAKKAELVGSNCSYSTGMMAQRVLEEGKPFTYTGTLASSANVLKSRVAAPYTIGATNELHVVANEVVERLLSDGADQARVTLAGRVLEVDGVQYFVATEFEPVHS